MSNLQGLARGPRAQRVGGGGTHLCNLVKSLLLTRLFIGTVKGEQKSSVHTCFCGKILCSDETAMKAQCVSEEVENFCRKLTGSIHAIVWKYFLKNL